MVALHSFGNPYERFKNKTAYMPIFSFHLYLTITLYILVSIKPVKLVRIPMFYTYSAIFTNGYS